ncbi:MAG TPA: hypothetical protein VLD61_10865 [Methylomirabilota bacterium]|nr:hypothetical protein [Methylomirabilota bacterium]
MRLGVVALAALLLAGAGLPRPVPGNEDPDQLPWIAEVVAPRGLRVGQVGELRLAFRAPEANVVAILVELEDLDGPVIRRASRARAVGVVTQAFGRVSGALAVDVSFTTPGAKRITLRLVTDGQAAGDPKSTDLEVQP